MVWKPPPPSNESTDYEAESKPVRPADDFKLLLSDNGPKEALQPLSWPEDNL